MKRVSVLIVVDVNAALAKGSPIDNAYLMDDNGFQGSWNESTSALHTTCQDGQVVTWSVAAVSPGSIIAIIGFAGVMVEKSVCVPVLAMDSQPPVWWGRVQSRGQFASFPYTVGLSLGSAAMSLSAFIKTV